MTRQVWLRTKMLLLIGLSIAIPQCLIKVDLTLVPFIFRWFKIPHVPASDMVVFGIGILAAVVLRITHINNLGIGLQNIRLDILTGILFILTVMPSVLMAKGISVGPSWYSFITTAVSEEFMCRGVWFGVVANSLGGKNKFLLSYPVLMSTLFFIVWHAPLEPELPPLWLVAGGIYTGMCLGMMRAHSRSLYPCILAHMINLLMLGR